MKAFYITGVSEHYDLLNNQREVQAHFESSDGQSKFTLPLSPEQLQIVVANITESSTPGRPPPPPRRSPIRPPSEGLEEEAVVDTQSMPEDPSMYFDDEEDEPPIRLRPPPTIPSAFDTEDTPL